MNPEPKTFHFLAPAPEEERAFAIQFLGTLLSLALLGVWVWRVPSAWPIALGAGAGAVWLLLSAALAFEKRGRRAQQGRIEVGEDLLRVVDFGSNEISWNSIQSCDVAGGKLSVVWRDGETQRSWNMSAREVENGIELVRLVVEKWNQARGVGRKTISMIPLEPR